MNNDDNSEKDKYTIGAVQETEDKVEKEPPCLGIVSATSICGENNPAASVTCVPPSDDPSTTSMTSTVAPPPPLVRHERQQSQPGAVAVPGPGSRRRFSSGESLMDSTVGASVVLRENSTHSFDDEGQLWSEVACENQPWSEVLINAVLVDDDPAVDHSTRDLPFVEATPMMSSRQPWYTKMCITSSLLLAVCIIIAIVVALTTEGTMTSPKNSPPTPPPSKTTPVTVLPATLAPSFSGLVDVSVVVQLDENPSETGWSLRCDSDDVMEVLPGTYDGNSANDKVVEIGQVEDGASCLFTIVDSGSNGINEGYFELYLGDDVTKEDNRLYYGIGDFADSVQVPFTAETPTSASPSATPSQDPSAAPTMPTTPPSESPSLAPAEVVAVTVVIRLDGKPAETSWRLKCGPRTIYNVPPRNYDGQEHRLVTVPAYLEVGDDCEFTIYDLQGNGLEEGGYFELYSGEDITDETARIAVGGDFEEEKTIEFQVVAPPTSAPTSSPAPTVAPPPEEEVVPISLVLRLDKFPAETGWVFQCNSTIHGYVPPSSYVEQFQLYTKTFYVQEGASCVFRITDSYGDGLCCRFGIGSFRLYLGEDTTIDSNIIGEGGTFHYIEEFAFTAGQPASTSPPVPAPPPSATLPSTENLPVTPPPEPSMVSITVAILMDHNPGDIGWFLECSDNVLVDMYPGTYSEPSQLVMETVQVDEGAECNVMVTDFFGDGLTDGGYFRVYLADITRVSDNNLLHEASDFGFQEQFQFAAAAQTP